MRHTYTILSEHRLFIEEIEGEFTIEELVFYSKRMFADPSYDATYDSVVDMRQATANMSKVELLGFADLMEQSGVFGKQARWAIIAEDPIVLTLSEAFKNRLDESDSMMIVRTAQEAADFIQNPETLNYLQQS